MKWCPRKLHLPSCCRKKKEVEDKVEEVSLKAIEFQPESLDEKSELSLDVESIKAINLRFYNLGILESIDSDQEA